MKAIATALVLIAGAAVVLWYGNTLNSWVLGGLIGGLAAVLISIPITMTLFSYLSRRHDELLRAETQHVSLAHISEYPDVPVRVRGRVYGVESYSLVEGNVSDGEEQRVPAIYQDQRVITSQQATPRQLSQSKQIASRRLTTRKMHYPGFYGYQPGSSLSQLRSQALHTARLETTQHDDDVVEALMPKKLPDQPLVEQNMVPLRASRQLTTNQRRARRTVALTSPLQPSRVLPAEEGQSVGSLNNPLVRRAPYMYDDDPLRQELAQQLDAPLVRRSSRYEARLNEIEGATD